MKMINQDTICAIATAQGGAIGIIRVSGPKAIEITSRIFTPATGKPLTERAPYTLTFGKICSPKRKITKGYIRRVVTRASTTFLKIFGRGGRWAGEMV